MSDTTTEPDSLNGTAQQRKRRLEILGLLTDHTLWKKRISQHFDVSVQTIGRDVDALHDDGLLTYTLMDADNAARAHYIGYTTTDTGDDIVSRYRICRECGDVVHVERGCLHDYIPIRTYRDDAGGGD